MESKINQKPKTVGFVPFFFFCPCKPGSQDQEPHSRVRLGELASPKAGEALERTAERKEARRRFSLAAVPVLKPYDRSSQAVSYAGRTLEKLEMVWKYYSGCTESGLSTLAARRAGSTVSYFMKVTFFFPASPSPTTNY